VNLLAKARLIYLLVVLALVASFLAKMKWAGGSDGATFR
jgi:hypothetical protein